MVLAQEGRINALVVEDRDRFARDDVVAANLAKQFRAYGVRLFSVNQGEFTPGVKNRYIDAIERTQALESAEYVKKNMRDKRYEYVMKKDTAPAGGVPLYGYDITGTKGNSHYVINEVEAEVVCLMFDLYIQRWTMDAIAALLNERGILQPSARKGFDNEGKEKERGHRFLRRGWTKDSVKCVIIHGKKYAGTRTAFEYAVRDDAPGECERSMPR